MNNKRNFSNLEDEIKDIVSNAIHKMDYNQLNKSIENTVENALWEVRNALGMNRDQNNFKHSSYHNKYSKQKQERWQDVKLKTGYQASRSDTKPVSPKSSDKQSITKAYPSNPIGKVAGILYTVFGWIFLPITGIAILVLTLLGFIMNQMNLFGTIALGIFPFLLISFFMTLRGSMIRARLRRFYRYISLFKDKSYYSIQDLSAQTQLSRKYITKDLRKMIVIGMFPEAHIDKQASCIMLNQESYQQYLQLQKNMQQKQSFNTPPAKEVSVNSEKAKESNAENPELQAIIEKGRHCIRQIREANDAIPGEEISNKLDRLELVIDKIFTHVERNPRQLSEINKFMEYYLPTTLKLVTAYKEFDLQPVQGENIRSAKKEIETTLDTINHAFEVLLDSLFEDAAMDIATDISVLETMLAQEGLTKRNFNPNDH